MVLVAVTLVEARGGATLRPMTFVIVPADGPVSVCCPRLKVTKSPVCGLVWNATVRAGLSKACT